MSADSEQRNGQRHEAEVLDGWSRSAVDRVAGRFRATRLEQALDWAASLAPAPLRLATSCCGMSMTQGGDFFEALGTGPPAVSSRSADLLVVAGSLTRRQVAMVREIHRRMLEPRWVIAWGACAISGGAYDNYATVSGLSRILPVDFFVPGCPPAPVALREALTRLRERRSRSRASASFTGRSSEPGDWPIQRHSPDPLDQRGDAAPQRQGGVEFRSSELRELT